MPVQRALSNGRHTGRAARSVAGAFAFGTSARDAGRLASKFAVARLASLLGLAAAGWLFSVEVFAAFGVYLALVNIAWIVAFLRYEPAVIAEDHANVGAAVKLCAVSAGAVLIVVCFITAGGTVAGLIRSRFALLFPLALLARVAVRLAATAASRAGDFTALGRVALLQAALQPTVLFVSAASTHDGALCLAIADLAGHAGAALYLCWRQRPFLAASLSDGWSGPEILGAARRWAGLPLFNLPGSLFSVGFVGLPLLLTPLVADPVAAGGVALALRIFEVPAQIIGAAATPVVLNRLGPRRGGHRAIFGRSLLASFGISIALLFCALALAVLIVAPKLEGTAFAHVHAYTPYAALFCACNALAGPLDEACGLYHKQRTLTAIHGLALLAGALLYAVGMLDSGTALLAGFGAIALVRAALVGERLRVLSEAPTSPAFV